MIFNDRGGRRQDVLEKWDVAIVGAGMGGATLALALAETGKRILLLERGRIDVRSTDPAANNDEPGRRLAQGWWPERCALEINGSLTQFLVPAGCGAGGTTLHYAAVLERFARTDFETVDGIQHPTGGWPVSYDSMRPFYERAEMLFRVRGTANPLDPDSGSDLLSPPPLSASDAGFVRSLERNGLHPYRLHAAISYVEGCEECPRRICDRGCRNDARTICIEPALKTGNVTLLDQCHVQRLDADASRVKRIFATRHDASLEVRARVFVLAAGSYRTPVLLLQSHNAFWPTGLANNSDQVGRNLMFHVTDYVAIWPDSRRELSRRAKIAFRDLYVHQAFRLGIVESLGLTAGYGNILKFLRQAFDRSRWRRLRPLRSMLRIPAYVAARILGRATIFAVIIEDMPYADNRIVLDKTAPSGSRIVYRVPNELRERVELMRSLLRARLRPLRSMLLQDSISLNYGHPCGTCRFGTDPSTSVLDANNKAHGVDNLYVVDASFMPTGGAVNPSLTIAANALRVANTISRTLAESRAEAQPRTGHENHQARNLHRPHPLQAGRSQLAHQSRRHHRCHREDHRG